MTLLLTSDEGHHKQRQCYVGLEILLLAFRTSRIFTETQFASQFVSQLFLNLRNSLHGSWIAQSLVLQYKHIPIYVPAGQASILPCKTSF